ncbi:MAG: hypothetical protein IPN93_06025 [Bacteroidetes bacterium]|nr:hypothetical protein [Bacteroidota bacterium]
MIKNVKFLFYFLVINFLCFGCKKKEATQISFYYWNTIFNIDKTEQGYIDTLKVKEVYVRFFDIIKENGRIKPNAQIDFGEKTFSPVIIPVVFIENAVFKNISETELNGLIQHLAKEVQFIYTKTQKGLPKEIQFDCDWTKTTAKAYFNFLEKFKANQPNILLSATIRLHQIKYFEQTGVPKIDKGVLMYYSTGNPLDFSDKNAILDNEIAKDYIKNIGNYPIKLDIALPIFSWAIVKNEFDETRLISGVKSIDLKDTVFFKPLEKHFFLVKKSNYLNGLYLYQGQRIKLETIEPADLMIAVKNIKKYYPNKVDKIIFYNLDGINFDNISTTDLVQISNSI